MMQLTLTHQYVCIPVALAFRRCPVRAPTRIRAACMISAQRQAEALTGTSVKIHSHLIAMRPTLQPLAYI